MVLGTCTKLQTMLFREFKQTEKREAGRYRNPWAKMLQTSDYAYSLGKSLPFPHTSALLGSLQTAVLGNHNRSHHPRWGAFLTGRERVQSSTELPMWAWGSVPKADPTALPPAIVLPSLPMAVPLSLIPRKKTSQIPWEALLGRQEIQTKRNNYQDLYEQA